LDLYIVRHAAAHRRDFDRWPDDSERPLTADGEEKFRPVARKMGEISGVDVVFSSPFVRAWQTAEILEREAGWPSPRPLPELEPERAPHKTLRALEEYDHPQSVALVGHRPHLHEFAAFLLTGEVGGIDLRIKKGGAVDLRFDDELVPGEAALRWLITPRLV
jgi:phosphohistidine phosphatase